MRSKSFVLLCEEVRTLLRVIYLRIFGEAQYHDSAISSGEIEHKKFENFPKSSVLRSVSAMRSFHSALRIILSYILHIYHREVLIPCANFCKQLALYSAKREIQSKLFFFGEEELFLLQGGLV